MENLQSLVALFYLILSVNSATIHPIRVNFGSLVNIGGTSTMFFKLFSSLTCFICACICCYWAGLIFLFFYAYQCGSGSAPNITFFDYLTVIGIPLIIFLLGCILVYLSIWFLKKTRERIFSKNNLIILAILGLVFTLLSLALYLPSIINKFSPQFVLSGDKTLSITKVLEKDIPGGLYHFQPPKKAKIKTWISPIEFKRVFHRDLQQVIEQKGSPKNLPILVEDKLYGNIPKEIKEYFGSDAKKIRIIFPHTKQYRILVKNSIQEEYVPDNLSPDKKKEFFIIRKAKSNRKEGSAYDSYVFIRDRASNKFVQYSISAFDPYWTVLDGGSIRWIFNKYILFGGSHEQPRGFIFNTQNGQVSQFFDAEAIWAICLSPNGKKAVIRFMSDRFIHGDGSSYLYDNLALFDGETGETIFIAKFKIMCTDREYHYRFNKFLGWKDDNEIYFEADDAYWKTILH